MLRQNIGRWGRLLRAGMGLILLAAAAGLVAADRPAWLALILVAGGLFGLFEAAAGWCAARACGIKTRI